MKPPAIGLRLKVILANVLVLFICSLAAMHSFRDAAEEQTHRDFEIRCRLVASMLMERAVDRLTHASAMSMTEMPSPEHLLSVFLVASEEMRYVALLDVKGRMVNCRAAPGFDPDTPSPPRPDDFLTKKVCGERVVQLDWEVAVPTSDPADASSSTSEPPRYTRAGYVRVGISMLHVDERIRVLHARFWLVFAVSVSAASLIIFVLIWPSIRRIKELIRGTERIAHGDFDIRIHDDKRDELTHLAHAFNAMAANLESLKQELEQNNRTLEHKVGVRTAELNEALEKLKTLDKMKDDFLSSVSHEFRTPLTSIRSFTEILLEVPEEDERTKREFLSIIRTESDRLTRLVNDILDLVKMEAGELRFEFKPVDLAELVERTVSSFYPIVQARSVMVHLQMTERLPRVWADADKITQVVFNVLGNALKFSPDGRGIDVEVTRAETMARVSVRDRGVGVPDGDLGRIFEKFNQVGDTLKNKPKGTGLGLSICRNLIERHGGRIWAERPNQGPGLRVVFEIPIVESERGEPAPAETSTSETQALDQPQPAAHEKTSPGA